MHGSKLLVLAVLALSFSASALERPSLLEAEQIFADYLDAQGALGTIESGLLTEVDGADLQTWSSRRDAALGRVRMSLKRYSAAKLSAADARVVARMSSLVAELAGPETADEPQPAEPLCKDATTQLQLGPLQSAMYACFDQVGNQLLFEGERLTRGGALQRLQELDEPERRKALFMALAPLWRAINAYNDAGSPYRRMIPLAAASYRTAPSPLADAAQAMQTDIAQLEAWLIDLLEAWRAANAGASSIEPWDYRHRYAKASRALNAALPLAQAIAVNQRFFTELGADPRPMEVLFDLAPRPGKEPIAYADTIRIGRLLEGRWRPAQARISANYDDGGLYTLNELVHETGHAVHYMAVRARPAFFWSDTLFIEAFADVPSWAVFEPAWQEKYLGQSVARTDAMRELFSLVMLDVAWGLFEIRMLRDPAADPNALWTEITSRYLGIAPHPELSWWAVRGQLVSSPGYMINYAIGAIITAEVRAHTRATIGPFDAGNPRWYAWLSQQLLASGGEYDTAELMQRFLGRPVSARALVEEIGKTSPAPLPRAP